MSKLRYKALSALEAHAKGEIEKHVYNIEIYCILNEML